MPLFSIGILSVDVTPFNFEESKHETGGDFAAKDIVGAQKPREFVGEADTKLSFSGKLFPHRFGGLDELETISQMAKSGSPQMVVRGDGLVFGWFLIEKVSHTSRTFNSVGIGREVEVSVEMVKSPTAASADAMLSTILGLFG